jgi:predicted Zn-dependent protease
MKKSERFQDKVAAQPNNMLFRFSLAQALTEEGETHNAIPHLEACADSRDDWMLPRILLGKALLETGAADCAKSVLEKALILAIEQDHNDPAAELRALLADL